MSKNQKKKYQIFIDVAEDWDREETIEVLDVVIEASDPMEARKILVNQIENGTFDYQDELENKEYYIWDPMEDDVLE